MDGWRPCGLCPWLNFPTMSESVQLFWQTQWANIASMTDIDGRFLWPLLIAEPHMVSSTGRRLWPASSHLAMHVESYIHRALPANASRGLCSQLRAILWSPGDKSRSFVYLPYASSLFICVSESSLTWLSRSFSTFMCQSSIYCT